MADATLDERRLSLAPEPQAAGAARRFLGLVLREVNREQWREDAELALTEVVTNAVLHAQSDLDLTVTVTTKGLRVEVRDRSARLPVQRSYGAQATTGRGLLLLAALTTDHGVRSLGEHGKVVWFTVDDPA